MQKRGRTTLVTKKHTASDANEMGVRTYIQTPCTEDLRNRFRDACKKLSVNRAAIGRALIEAWVKQVETGERPLPPFTITEKEAHPRRKVEKD
jgi:hypothetical protein